MTRRRWPWLLAAIALLIAGGAGYDKLQFRRSDLGFRHVTGVDLPANVAAFANGQEMNDNLLHTTHYWRLQGPRAYLREFAKEFGLTRSDEDAGTTLQEAMTILPMGPNRLIEGYEGSRDGGRDRWLIVVEPGDQAVFAY